MSMYIHVGSITRKIPFRVSHTDYDIPFDHARRPFTNFRENLIIKMFKGTFTKKVIRK